jgi:hypothetical protein
VKEGVLQFENPSVSEAPESPEHLSGSFVHVQHGAEHGVNGTAGYQLSLSEATPLGNGIHGEDPGANDISQNRTVPPGGLNFFQTSELETDTYPTSAHGGFPTQGISFLQESELGTSQPHEDYTQGERADEVDDLQESPKLPPIQTRTDTDVPPIVNLGVGSAAATAGIGEAGNAAAEKILSKTPSQQGWGSINTESKAETKTDWAEEASPTTETAPALPEKKKEEEWTTQASRHARHQSQPRGGRGGGRGGREGWRGGEGRGEGRGGSRGGYRGGRGGERGTSNPERRGSWRGGERGRGRGGSLPSTAV